MKRDVTRYLLSLLALAAAVILGGFYCFWPLTKLEQYPRLHQLVLECIPEAVVALMATVVVYWLLERQGVLPPRHHSRLPSFSEAQATMTIIPEEVTKAETSKVSPRLAGSTKMLIVVDVQNDFISGALRAHNPTEILPPLNTAIQIAEYHQLFIVFTKDWHPANHSSFRGHGGHWPPHCIQGTEGAKLSSDLYIPPNKMVVEFGVEPGLPGYSPLENKAFNALLDSSAVQTVFVTGIALEYCVQATCLDVRARNKRVIALAPLIASASSEINETEKIWAKLIEAGIERATRISIIGDP